MSSPGLFDIKNSTLKVFGDINEFTIGRSVQSTLDIPSCYISRNQCVIRKEDSVWKIFDVSSFKSTRVNGTTVSGGGHVLKDGDRINFLNYKDCEFVYYSNCDNIPNSAKKRKHSDVIDDSVIEICTPLPGPSKGNSISSKLEDENNKLRDSVQHYTQMVQQAQQSLNTLDTENKTLKDKLVSETQSKTEMLKEIEELQERLRECESEQQRIMDEYRNYQQSSNKKEPILKSCTEKIWSNPQSPNHLSTPIAEYSNSLKRSPEMTFTSGSFVNVNEYEPWDFDHVEELDRVETEYLRKSDTPEKVRNEDVNELELNYLKIKVDYLMEDIQKKESMLTEVEKGKENFRGELCDALEREFTCGICNELYYQPSCLTCRHTFCDACITEWKKKKKECPLCREKIKYEVKPLVLDNLVDRLTELLGGPIKSRRDELKTDRAKKVVTPPARTPRRKGARRRRIPNEIIDLSGYGVPLIPMERIPFIGPDVIDLTSTR